MYFKLPSCLSWSLSPCTHPCAVAIAVHLPSCYHHPCTLTLMLLPSLRHLMSALVGDPDPYPWVSGSPIAILRSMTSLCEKRSGLVSQVLVNWQVLTSILYIFNINKYFYVHCWIVYIIKLVPKFPWLLQMNLVSHCHVSMLPPLPPLHSLPLLPLPSSSNDEKMVRTTIRMSMSGSRDGHDSTHDLLNIMKPNLIVNL